MADLALAFFGLDPLPEGNLKASIQWASRVGFRAVTLDAKQVRGRDLDRSARRDLAAHLRRTEVAFAGLDLWIPSGHFRDDSNVDRAVGAVLDAISLCDDLATLDRLMPYELPIKGKVLKLGDKGGDVRALQTVLTQLGYHTGAIDGVFGRGTRSGIERFQSMIGAEQTGELTERQFTALTQLAGPLPDPVPVAETEPEEPPAAQTPAPAVGQPVEQTAETPPAGTAAPAGSPFSQDLLDRFGSGRTGTGATAAQRSQWTSTVTQAILPCASLTSTARQAAAVTSITLAASAA